jgi:hypothetical protein
VLTCAQARNRAITIIGATKNGEDPAARRRAERHAITVTKLAQHIDIRLKPSTAKGYKRMLERFVLPTLGHYRVTEVTRPAIAKFHHDLRHIPYDANRCLEMISKMFNLAEMWGLRPEGSNPRKHINKYPEAAGARHRRGDPGRTAAGGGDASGADAAVRRGVAVAHYAHLS